MRERHLKIKISQKIMTLKAKTVKILQFKNYWNQGILALSINLKSSLNMTKI